MSLWRSKIKKDKKERGERRRNWKWVAKAQQVASASNKPVESCKQDSRSPIDVQKKSNNEHELIKNEQINASKKGTEQQDNNEHSKVVKIPKKEV